MSVVKVPLGLSSFFAICCNLDEILGGKRRELILKAGSIGGGFKLEPMVKARVEEVERKGEGGRIEVYINGERARQATTEVALKILFDEEKLNDISLKVEISIPAPISAGFGTSAAGTFAALIAACRELKIPRTLQSLAQITHIAEITCRTGLGTISGIFSPGSCVLVTKPGAPGYCNVDSIPLDNDMRILVAYFGEIDTRKVLARQDIRGRINSLGFKALSSILEEPTITNFLRQARMFSMNTPLKTLNVIKTFKVLEKLEVVGYAQNMIGDAVHILLAEDYIPKVKQVLEEKIPKVRVLVFKPTTIAYELE